MNFRSPLRDHDMEAILAGFRSRTKFSNRKALSMRRAMFASHINVTVS